jgi:hypothetical protein
MTEAIIVIAGQIEGIARPVTERHERVGVVPAEHQDRRVHGDQCVGERGQRKARPRERQQRHHDHDRRDFQHPGGTVHGPDAGPDETDDRDQP